MSLFPPQIPRQQAESQATDGHLTLDSTEALYKSTDFSKMAEQRAGGIKSIVLSAFESFHKTKVASLGLSVCLSVHME